MASIFTRIVAGEIPCYKIAEDENFFAFLDINPMAAGHTLVIPKKEVDYLFDLDSDLYAALCLFARRVALAQKKALNCKRVGMLVLGMEVPHAHIHLVPMEKESDLSIAKPKLKLTEEEFKATCEKIKQAFR
jgi:histidine triad (HIT) family protein